MSRPPVGSQILIERDAIGRVLAEAQNGRRIESVYDALGQRVRRRTPSGAESRFEYGPVGRLDALHTAGRTLRFAYDLAGARPDVCWTPKRG